MFNNVWYQKVTHFIPLCGFWWSNRFSCPSHPAKTGHRQGVRPKFILADHHSILSAATRPRPQLLSLGPRGWTTDPRCHWASGDVILRIPWNFWTILRPRQGGSSNSFWGAVTSPKTRRVWGANSQIWGPTQHAWVDGKKLQTERAGGVLFWDGTSERRMA